MSTTRERVVFTKQFWKVWKNSKLKFREIMKKHENFHAHFGQKYDI
jgi:hypothetical protein